MLLSGDKNTNTPEQAIEYVKVAVAEDEAGNYEKALQNYKAALEYFQAHLKYEKNPRSAEAIKAKLIGEGGRRGGVGWSLGVSVGPRV